MHPLVANTDDLISVLDRVLDKGIVLESWARLSLQETGPGHCREQNFRRIVGCVRRLRHTRHVAGRPGAGRLISLLAARALEQIVRPRGPEFVKNRTVDFLVMWRYSAVTRERRAIQIYEEF